MVRFVSQYDDFYCVEHHCKASKFLDIAGVLIPLCDTCLDELKEAVNAESTDRE